MAGNLLLGRRILIVEDEMIILLSLEQMLLEQGCAVVELAATIDQALDLIRERKLDAATLDINLNGSDSLPVAEALAAHAVPFVFMTGYPRRHTHGPYADRPTLTKPVGEQALISALTQIL